MSAIRIKEFTSKLSNIKYPPLTLTNCQQWVALDNAINDNNDSDIIEEKKEALGDLIEQLGNNKMKILYRVKQLVDLEVEYLSNTHATSTLLKVDIPNYNHAIKRLNARHPALAFFKATKKRSEDNSKYRQKVRTQAGTRTFQDIDGYIKTALKLLESNSYIAVAMGISALTGRRPSEVLLTAKFKEATELRIYFDDDVIEFDEGVVFCGQMKTKEAKDARDNYLIPVLSNADTLINALSKLRKMKDLTQFNETIVDKNGRTKSPGQRLNDLCAKGQNECAKRYFSKFFAEEFAKPYDLRHCYALIAQTWFCENANQVPKFLGSILGHRHEDESTSHSYMALRLKSDNEN